MSVIIASQSDLFPGSSAVERKAVNFKVLGSNPSRGARSINITNLPLIAGFFMENIGKFLSYRNLRIELIWNDVLLLMISGIFPLIIASNIKLPDHLLGLSLYQIKHLSESISLISWILFTFTTFLVLKFLLHKVTTINLHDKFVYSPPFELNHVLFQGWLEIKDNKEIFLTNSNSGLLFKKPWFRDCEIECKFKFEYLENAIVGGIFQESPQNKLHKFNYLGILFRSQSLEDYFMFSIGVLINIDDYRKLRDKYFQDEKALFKNKEFDVIITPHIRLNGSWEVFGGRSLGTKIRLTEFEKVTCRISNTSATIEINNHSLTWNLPTSFDQKPNPNERGTITIDTEKIPSTFATQIPFRLKPGMVGFRSYGAEHSIIKDIVITKI